MKVLICGYGSTGQYVVDMLSRLGVDDLEINILSRKALEEIAPRLNTTVISSMIMGSKNSINYFQCSMDHVEEIEKVLNFVSPDIVAYTGRFISHVKYGSFSYPNDIGYGVWTPLSLPLVYNLMRAIKSSGIKCKVIDTSHPDIVDPLLKSLGYQVFTGLGNINHMIPRIKKAILDSGFYPKNSEVKIRLICSHFLNTYACRDGSDRGSPYYLDYSVNGEVRSELSNEFLIQSCKIPMVSDSTRNLMIASDTVQVIKILVGNKVDTIHLPGPNGLIGGYPCIISPFYESEKVELDLPDGISLEAAEEINRVSSQYDGVESISNGVLTFMDKDIKKLKNVFDIDYPKSIHADECFEFAKKLADRLAKF